MNKRCTFGGKLLKVNYYILDNEYVPSHGPLCGGLPDAKEFYLNISVKTVASESERVRRRVPPCILMI